MKNTFPYQLITLFFVISVTCFALAFYALGWTEPTAAPPAGNIDVPINIGGTGQTKTGALTVSGGFESSGLTLLATQAGAGVGIGTVTAPLGKLNIQGASGTRGITLDLNESPGGVNAPFLIWDSRKGGATYLFGVRQVGDGLQFRRYTDYWAGSMNIMTIKAIDTATEAIGGRVGIGTANPTEALHVVGEIYAHDGDVCQRSPIPPNEITCLSSVRAFGVWNDRNKNGSPNTVAFNTTYLAQTDGFVCALLIITSGDGLGYLRGYTDSSNPPTTARAWTNEEQEETGRIQESITFPVRKGDYWKVDMYAPGSGTKKVYWMPIGN